MAAFLQLQQAFLASAMEAARPLCSAVKKMKLLRNTCYQSSGQDEFVSCLKSVAFVDQIGKIFNSVM